MFRPAVPFLGDRLRSAAPWLVASVLCALVVGGCAVVDHFRYPTGKDDALAYRAAMAATDVGMSRADFEALWAGDEKGHRVLAVEEVPRGGRAIRTYYIGFTIEYMEAAGRDVDLERRRVIVPTTPAEQDSVRLQAPPPSTEFWTKVRVTDVVTTIDGVVARIAKPE